MGLAVGAANTQMVGAGVFEPARGGPLSAMVEVQEIAPARGARVVIEAGRFQPVGLVDSAER